jgi:hypothetical protein
VAGNRRNFTFLLWLNIFSLQVYGVNSHMLYVKCVYTVLETALTNARGLPTISLLESTGVLELRMSLDP